MSDNIHSAHVIYNVDNKLYYNEYNKDNLKIFSQTGLDADRIIEYCDSKLMLLMQKHNIISVEVDMSEDSLSDLLDIFLNKRYALNKKEIEIIDNICLWFLATITNLKLLDLDGKRCLMSKRTIDLNVLQSTIYFTLLWISIRDPDAVANIIESTWLRDYVNLNYMQSCHNWSLKHSRIEDRIKIIKVDIQKQIYEDIDVLESLIQKCGSIIFDDTRCRIKGIIALKYFLLHEQVSQYIDIALRCKRIMDFITQFNTVDPNSENKEYDYNNLKEMKTSKSVVFSFASLFNLVGIEINLDCAEQNYYDMLSRKLKS